MQALKVCHFRLITSFNQYFKTGLYQRTGTATKNSLLAEQISFCFFLESCSDNASTSRTNALRPCESKLSTIALLALVNRNQSRHTLAFKELTAHNMARPLRRNHDYVHVLRRFDKTIKDTETVYKQEGLSGCQVWCNIVGINRPLL